MLLQCLISGADSDEKLHSIWVDVQARPMLCSLATPYIFMQVDKMIGMGAPEDFVQNLEQLANTHHDELSLDRIRAYHFGQRFIVEMEVVLPAQMSVRESHDIALILQHKVQTRILALTYLVAFASMTLGILKPSCCLLLCTLLVVCCTC